MFTTTNRPASRRWSPAAGRADKDQVMRAVNMRLALPNPITQTDVADAIGIAICHVQLTLNDATVKAVALTKQTAQA